MKSLQRAARAVPRYLPSRNIGIALAAAAATFLPTSALAAEGEHISLKFTGSQPIWLWAALGVGVVGLLYALLFLRSFVLAQSPGSDKMQAVGLAIREGALAYLQKQIKTMAIFIVLLFCGLVALNWSHGPAIAFGVGGCFVAGVIASYVSGYAGMLMAVNGNMRTANAALSSYRLSLVTAFRSGAVAGMVTVSIGLIGATLILLIAPAMAPSLLVGFGFGASLAALFMRVGGGIFTKAADVGADLVGKVEAGIPEDDPRNPAVIADNVGDNVGDCAGMAADVFESYEVTLIASIVLAAATASIFDAQTWPRLVVFGLGASAIGLLASLIGIQLVSGSDDPQADPLAALKQGFAIAAAISFVGVGLLSFFSLNGIKTSQLVPVLQYEEDEIRSLQSIQRELADKQGKQPYEITVDQVMADPRVKKMGFDPVDDKQQVQGILGLDEAHLPKLPDLSGLSKVTDFNDTANKTLDFAVQNQPTPGSPPTEGAFKSLISMYGASSGSDKWVIGQVHEVAHVSARPGLNGQPAQAERNIDKTMWVGPIQSKILNDAIDRAHKSIEDGKKAHNVDGPQQVDLLQTKDAQLFTSPDGRVALGIDGSVTRPGTLESSWSQGGHSFYALPYATANANAKSATAGSPPALPAPAPIELAVVHETPVPWWAFWLTLSFGILMAFAIEYVTDYFVSTHKAPTQEVAGVASAGAAPMIIQGFAHALTSSVFMVLAIVVALMFPLFMFNPAVYGGYTLSFYGIALIGLGLLTATAYILAMDTFGPISDNAQGVFEMSGAGKTHPDAAKVIARLDAAGNTTKALTKGFAIATAVVAAVALFHSFLENAHLTSIGLRLDIPEIFLGLLIGGAAPYLFSAFAINAVGRSSFELINEVRRQFREDAGIMKGTSKPNYFRCVEIVTAAAQKELLAPGILAITLPAAVGFGFSIGKPTVLIGGTMYNLTGAQALGGFLAGAIVSGQLMAVLLANSGGMWDNAKKLVEEGMHGGKGTEAHRAAVVADTIGDPFKDTAGPALNPLIKVMNLVALLLSPVVILPLGTPVLVAITSICVLALLISITLARRGSMSDALQQAANAAGAVDVHFTKTGEKAMAGPSAQVSQDVLEPVAVEAASAEDSTPRPAGKKKLFVEEDPPAE